MALSRDLLTRWLGDEKDLVRSVRNVEKNTGGVAKKVDQFGSRMRTAFNVVAVGGVLQMGNQLLELGIQAEAMGSRFDTVFGAAGGGITADVNRLADRLGVAEVRMKGMAAAVGDFLVPLGFAREQAADMAVQVLDVAGALKEFTGDTRTAEEIARIVAKSFTGEADALKELGVVITAAEVTQRLAAGGFQNLTGQALKQQKALITLDLIMEQSTDALSAYAEGQTEAEAAAASARQSMDEVRLSLAETVVELAPLVDGIGELIGALNEIPGGAGAAVAGILTFIATKNPVIATAAAIVVLGNAASETDFKMSELVASMDAERAEAEKMTGVTASRVQAFRDQAEAMGITADQIREVGDRIRNFLLGPLEDAGDETATVTTRLMSFEEMMRRVKGQLAVDNFATELQSITIDAAESLEMLLGVWDSLPEKIAEVDIAEAMQEAIDITHLNAEFEENARHLTAQGLGGLVDELRTNPDKAEAIALMEFFASDLAAAAAFSDDIGVNADEAFAELNRRVADTARWQGLADAYRSQGAAMMRAYVDGFVSDDSYRDLVSRLQRLASRTGPVGI